MKAVLEVVAVAVEVVKLVIVVGVVSVEVRNDVQVEVRVLTIVETRVPLTKPVFVAVVRMVDVILEIKVMVVRLVRSPFGGSVCGANRIVALAKPVIRIVPTTTTPNTVDTARLASWYPNPECRGRQDTLTRHADALVHVFILAISRRVCSD